MESQVIKEKTWIATKEFRAYKTARIRIKRRAKINYNVRLLLILFQRIHSPHHQWNILWNNHSCSLFPEPFLK